MCQSPSSSYFQSLKYIFVICYLLARCMESLLGNISMEDVAVIDVAK